MAETMKAACIDAYKAPLTIRDVPRPVPKRGEILVKTKTCGLCHTDVHIIDCDWPLAVDFGRIPGHEGCGDVVEVGPGVDSVKIGDRVGVPFIYSACGNCRFCCMGWETTCSKIENTGASKDGGMAEYILADAKYIGKIPAKLSYEQAAPIMCAGVTAYKALKMSEVKPGEWVLIHGAAGGLGHVAVQYAKAMGMKVIAVSRSVTEAKKKMFDSYGVDHVIDLSKDNLAEVAAKVTGGDGPDGVVCFAPNNKDIGDAVMYVRKCGTIVPVGIQSGNFEANTFHCVLKGVKIVGSIVGTRNDLQESLDFAAEGKVKCQIQTMPFGRVNEAVDLLRKAQVQGRIVITL